MNPSKIAIFLCFLYIHHAGAVQKYTFNPALLEGGGKDIDIRLFNDGGQLPGVYSVDIVMNGSFVDSRDIDFRLKKNQDGNQQLEPCLSKSLLSKYGLRVEDFPFMDPEHPCADLSIIPYSRYDFQFNNQQLLISIPQKFMRQKQTGIAPKELWDDGISALLMNYNANTTRLESRPEDGDTQNSVSHYVQLQPGANIGPWRLRNQSNWQQQDNMEGKWETAYTYAERGINQIESRFILGDKSTPGEVFDAFPVRGVMLGTDENMIPYDQRSYSPIIRGIARTQARIEVKQNGYVLYSAVVAPGPFALTDLNLQGNGGNLNVTVYETDGASQVFTVPYQTPVIAVREGFLKYHTMIGRYRPSNAELGKAVGQVTMMYGLPFDLTAYSGYQMAEHYQAGSVGIGLSMGSWGAVSLDTTGSRSQRQGYTTEEGRAWRVRYGKDITSTDTSLTLSSSHYTSSGYDTLMNVLDSWGKNSGDPWGTYNPEDKPKSNTSLTLNQSLGSYGGLSLTGTRQNYWNRDGNDDSCGISYSMMLYGDTSVSVNWYRNNTVSTGSGEKRTETLTSVWLSIPLKNWLNGSTNASYQLASPSEGRSSHEAGLNGWASERQLFWDVRQRYAPGQDSSSSALSLNWYGRYGQVGGDYSYSPHQRQMGASVSGGMLIHQNGFTLGQTVGDTSALVEAPGAAGVPVGGWPGIKTDFRGYTTVPHLIPYQENTVSLDVTQLPSDAEIAQTEKKVIPTYGAIVSSQFATRIGARAMMTLKDRLSKPLPFGAMVTSDTENGTGTGIVGENSQVYLTGLTKKGTLRVQWGENKQCLVDYELPDSAGDMGLYLLNGVCR